MHRGRWPKKPQKRAKRRQQLEAAKGYKRALQRRDGQTGAASNVRTVDPESPEGQEIIRQLGEA